MLKFILAVVFANLFLSPSNLWAGAHQTINKKTGIKETLAENNQKNSLLNKEEAKKQGEKLILSVKKNDLNGLYEAIWKGADMNYVDKYGRSALSYALDEKKRDNTEIVRVLLDGCSVWKPTLDVDIEEQGTVTVDEGLYRQQADVKLTSNYSANVGCYMFNLVKRNKMGLFQKMLEKGYNPNSTCGKERYHLLSLLLMENPQGEAQYKQAAELLLTYKADPFSRDELGNTPLHYAVATFAPKAGEINLKDSLVPQLIQRAALGLDKIEQRQQIKALVLAQNNVGVTPLMISIFRNADKTFNLLEYLISLIPACSGSPTRQITSCLIDLQLTHPDAQTVYMIAAQHGARPFCLVRRLNPSELIEDAHGYTAYDMIDEKYRERIYHGECEQMLKGEI